MTGVPHFYHRLFNDKNKRASWKPEALLNCRHRIPIHIGNVGGSESG